MRRRLSLVVAALLCLVLIGAALSAFPTNAQRSEIDLDAIEDELTKETVLEWARIAAPKGDVGVLVTFDFPGEDPLMLGTQAIHSLTIDLPPDGGMFVRNATGGGTGSGGDAAGACQDPTFMPLGVRWRARDLPIEWKLNLSSKPNGITPYATKRASRRAHHAWPQVRTNCDETPKNDFAWDLRGLSQRRVKRDRVNLVDFGGLGGGALATAYTWYVDHRIIEADVRLNKKDYRWTNRADGDRAYQVINVLTHELGHSLGLDDLNYPHGGQTMYGRTYKGELKKTTLGRGDMRGAKLISP